MSRIYVSRRSNGGLYLRCPLSDTNSKQDNARCRDRYLSLAPNCHLRAHEPAADLSVPQYPCAKISRCRNILAGL